MRKMIESQRIRQLGEFLRFKNFKQQLISYKKFEILDIQTKSVRLPNGRPSVLLSIYNLDIFVRLVFQLVELRLYFDNALFKSLLLSNLRIINVKTTGILILIIVAIFIIVVLATFFFLLRISLFTFSYLTRYGY